MSRAGGGVGGREVGTMSSFTTESVVFEILACEENRQETVDGYLPGT